MQNQIDEINDRLDQNDSDTQDYQSDISDHFDDFQSSLDDNSSSIEELNQNVGQLAFPLTQDTVDLIKEQFPCGFVTLSAGQATITDARISAISNMFLTYVGSGAGEGTLSYVASNGSAIIYSTSNTDTNKVSYLILN